jgi:16S rRNA (cytosine967-C5)-methyltransferase
MPNDPHRPPGEESKPEPGKGPNDREGWRHMVRATPEGGFERKFRPPKGPRPPRPGRREREQVKLGERPFFRRKGPPGPPPGPGGGEPPRPQGAEFRRAGGAPPPGGPGPRGPALPFGDRPGSGRPVFSRGAPSQPRGDRDYPRDDRSPGSPARRDGPRGPMRSFDRAGGPPRPGPGRGEFRRPAPAPVPPPPSGGDLRQARVNELAAQIIAQTTPERPADAVLRETLRTRRDLPPGVDREVALTVFAYYRWRGWLDPAAPMAVQLARSDDLAANFRRNPRSFTLADLKLHAAPPWVADAVQAPAGWWASLQQETVLWLRARGGSGADVAATLGAEPGPLPDSVRYAGMDDLFRTDLFHHGRFEIQDIASQAVGWVCRPLPGECWWDACAGEGGKMLHLASLMNGQGLVWASDRAEWRLDKLRRRAARAGCFNYRTVLWDGGPRPPTKTKFHGVLVDAPCSGVGTWGRNPHARWTLDPGEPAELAVVQRQLLDHAAGSVRPGGRLVYAVCTVTTVETTAVAAAFTAAHSADFEPLATTNPFRNTDASSPTRMLWPHETGGNGMFVAVWKRK